MKTYEFEGQGGEKLRIVQKGRDWPKLQEFYEKEWHDAHQAYFDTFKFAIWDQLCRVTDMMPKNPR
jgi:hypothetical protein